MIPYIPARKAAVVSVDCEPEHSDDDKPVHVATVQTAPAQTITPAVAHLLAGKNLGFMLDFRTTRTPVSSRRSVSIDNPFPNGLAQILPYVEPRDIPELARAAAADSDARAVLVSWLTKDPEQPPGQH